MLSAEGIFLYTVTMTLAEFEHLSLILGIGGLMAFMLFIVWDLARQSKAGRLGTLILFLALALGLAGFVIKAVLVEFIDK